MRRLVPHAALAGAALGLLLLAFLLLPADDPRIWKGYRILLVEAKASPEEICARLAKAGYPDVLAETTQPIQISDYSGLETIGLASAQSRLSEKDPRRDRWIDNLPAWFAARIGDADYRIYYIKDRPLTGGGVSAKSIARALKGMDADFVLPEAERSPMPAMALFAVAICFAAAAMLLDSSRRRSPLIAALLVPWVILTLRGWSTALDILLWEALAGLVAPGLLLAAEEYRISSGWKRALGLAGRALLENWPLLLPALGSFWLFPSSLPGIFMAVGSSLCSFLALAAGSRASSSPPRRRFVPVSIAPGLAGRKPLSRGTLTLSYLAALVAAGSLAMGGLAPRLGASTYGAPQGGSAAGRTITLPQPVAVRGNPRPFPADARKSGSDGTEGELVNASDWLIHRWYEEALFYLPLKERNLPPFSSVIVPLPGGRTAASRSFDPAWAREAWANRPAGGIETLLISGPTFLKGKFLPLSMYREGPLAPIQSLLYIILMAPPTAGALLLYMRGFRSRRERREAQ